MLENIINWIVILLAIIFAVLTITIKNLNRAISAFAVFSVVLSVAFYLLGAPYVAVFQLLVFTGAVTVLFLAALHTVEGGESE